MAVGSREGAGPGSGAVIGVALAAGLACYFAAKAATEYYFAPEDDEIEIRKVVEEATERAAKKEEGCGAGCGCVGETAAENSIDSDEKEKPPAAKESGGCGEGCGCVDPSLYEFDNIVSFF